MKKHWVWKIWVWKSPGYEKAGYEKTGYEKIWVWKTGYESEGMKDVGVKCHAAVFLKVMINLKTFFSYLFSINVNKRFAKDYLYIYKLDFSYYAFL